MRYIIQYLACTSVALVLAMSANGQPSVPLPNGKKLELKRTPAPEAVQFPEIKPPMKGGTTTTGNGSSTAVKEQVLELGKKAKFGGGLQFLPDGESLLSAVDEMVVWDLKTSKPRYVIEGKLYRLGTLQGLFGVSADERSFYVLEEEKVDNRRTAILRHRDISTGKPLRTTRLEREGEILAGFLLAGEKNAVTLVVGIKADAPITVRLTDLSTGKTVKDLASFKGSDPRWEDPGYASSTLPVVVTRVSDRKKKEHQALRIYDAVTGEFRREISLDQGGEKGAIANLGLGAARNGKTLAVSPPFYDDLKQLGKSVRIFNMDSGTLKKSFPVTDENVVFTSLVLTPKGDKVALVGLVNPKDGPDAPRTSTVAIVVVFDVATGKLIKAWRFTDGPLFTIAISPDGAVLATGGMRVGKTRADDIGIVRILRVNDSPAGGTKDPVAIKPGGPTPEGLAEVQRLNAQFAARRGDKNSVSHYQQLLKDNPNDAGLNLGLGQVLAKRNQFADAATVLQKAADGDPKNPVPRQALAEVLTNHAQDLANKEKWAEATQQARRALTVQPTSAQPHGILARSLFQQGEPIDAAKHVQKAQVSGIYDPTLAGKIAERLSELGKTASDKKDHAGAIEPLHLATVIDAQKSAHHAALANALLGAKRTKEAVEAIETAMRLEPSHVAHRQAAAAMFRHSGRFADAERVLRSLLLTRPDDKQAQSALIDCVLRQGRQTEAKQLAQQMLNAGLLRADFPELVRSFLDADKAGQPFRTPGIPPVVGLSAAEAKKALESAGAKVTIQVGAAAPSPAKVNTIYAMDPEPGAPIAKDTVVAITLYGPVSTSNANLAMVPDLSGLSAKAARDLLEREGLSGKFELGNAAPTKAKGLTVARSEPAGGTQVAKGSEVTVTLFGQAEESKDGLIGVPDLAGLTSAKAKLALEELGFKASFQLGKAAPTKKRSLTVFQSDPAAGARVAKGAAVKVTLYAPHDGKNEPPEPKDAVKVPDCLTLSLDEATTKLKVAGFTVTSKVGRPASFAGQIERVYQMEPRPGTRIAQGGTIELLIYGNRKDGP